MYLDRLNFLPKEKEEELLQYGYQAVTFEDKDRFDPYYDEMTAGWSSPMSFMAMIAWQTALKFYYKPVGNFLACMGWDATDGRMTLLPLFGKYEQSALEEAFAIVKQDWDAMGYLIVISDMQEWMRPYYDGIAGTKWNRVETDALYDYVYDAERFDKFTGKSGQNLRYFLKNCEPTVEEVTADDFTRLSDFIREIWCSHTDCAECNYGCPIDCIKNVLPCLDRLSGYGIIVTIDGSIAGYCIGSGHGDKAILHFQNTRDSYKGLGVFMYSEIRKRFLSGVSLISLGEDMGVPGIRTYKSRLAPHDWIPRFEYDLIK